MFGQLLERLCEKVFVKQVAVQGLVLNRMFADLVKAGKAHKIVQNAGLLKVSQFLILRVVMSSVSGTVRPSIRNVSDRS